MSLRPAIVCAFRPEVQEQQVRERVDNLCGPWRGIVVLAPVSVPFSITIAVEPYLLTPIQRGCDRQPVSLFRRRIRHGR